MSEHFEVAIIGAGPGGIGAATNAAHHKLSHILFEKSEIGNTIFNYQLRKHVMAEPNKLPLRCLAKFTAGTRENVLEDWNRAITEHRVNLRKAEVTSISKQGDKFEIKFGGGEVTATNVVLAIGCQGTPRKLGVPGEDLPSVAYTLSDPDAFQNKDIVVVGAGDAAIENALALVEQNRVSILNRGADFPLAKDANARAILKAVENGKLRCFFNSSMARVEQGKAVINSADGEVSISCDHLIARIGAIMPRKFLEACGIKFPNADMTAVPVVNHRYESNVPGLFIVGALIGYPLIKQAMNQGFEVIEHLKGNAVEPADQILIEERLKVLSGSVSDNYKMIREKLSLFAALSDPQYRELLIDSTIHQLQGGETLFKLNDYTDSCFSVIKGQCIIELPNGAKVKLSAGSYVGEMSLLSGRRRSATVKTSEDSLLLETPRRMMLKLVSAVEDVRNAINRKFVLNALQTAIFPEVEQSLLEKIVERSTLKRLKKGEALFNEGDAGDQLFVIRKGSVKVSRKNASGENVAQAYLAAGNYVGEMALLAESPEPRSATVTAAVPCEIVAISKEDFQSILGANARVKARISELAEARRLENITTDWNKASGDLLDFMLSQGVSDAENVLLIDTDKCVGCDNCEAACAATHGGDSRLDRKGGKSFASIQVPISCRHCENPLCMVDCPPDALVRRPNGEVIIQDSCIGCGNCVRNCPYGVIQLVYDKPARSFSLLNLFKLGKSGDSKESKSGAAKAGKCDMCSSLPGGPACVRSCPTGAAMRVNPRVLVQLAGRQGS